MQELEGYVKEVVKGWFFFAVFIGPMLYKTYMQNLSLRDEMKQEMTFEGQSMKNSAI